MSNENIKRNFLWNTAGSLIYFAAQWLFTILVWRLTDEGTALENAGLLTMSTTITNVFLSFASYGMYNYQVSDTSDKYSANTYILSRNITCVAAALLCGAYMLFISGFSTPLTIVQVVCVLLMLVFKMVESKTDVFNAIDQKNARLDIVGKTYALRGIISLFAFVGALYISGSMAVALLFIVIFNVALYVFFTVPFAGKFYTRQKAGFKSALLLLAECAPLAVYSVLNTTTTSVPRLFLERISGAEMLGIYGSVTAPVLLLQVGATYLFTPFITTFANAYNLKNKKAFYKAMRFVTLIICALLPVGIAVAHFLGPWGLRVFVNPVLVQYSYLLAPMVISAVLTALVLFFSMVLTVMRCMRGLLVANVLAILTSFAVSVPLINLYDMQGATFACIAALSVQIATLLVFAVIYARRHFKG